MSKGQYFTTNSELQNIVFSLCKNKGKTLEPSAGPGFLVDFFKSKGKLIDVAIEVDETLKFITDGITIMNFFDFQSKDLFDTILGNPPYVKYKDIEERFKIKSTYNSLNLYLYFIEKCFYHLNYLGGELVFIIPRDFFLNTRAKSIRNLLWHNGTITDVIDFQEKKLFKDANPYVIIIRYEKGNFSHLTNYTLGNVTTIKKELLKDDFIRFSSLTNNDNDTLDNYFDIKVGLVSGANKIFESEEFGNIEIICSDFLKTKKKRKFIFSEEGNYSKEVFDYLKGFKQQLMSRKIKSFNDYNWFEWGAVRNLKIMKQNGNAIYVNGQTREQKPFFVEKLGYFSTLALIPKNKTIDLSYWVEKLNNSNKEFIEQNFMVGNKYQFSPKNLSKFIV